MSSGSRQQRARSASSRFFSLLAALWLGLALQPCAMAEFAKSDCPHCPTKIEHATTHEAHCDPVAKVTTDEIQDCDAVQAECCHLDEGIVNARADKADDHDEPIGLVSSPPSSLHGSGPCEDPENAGVPPDPPGRPVPLHVLKCVYLN